MNNDKIDSLVQIFICNHKRENQEDCFHKGGKVLTDEIKMWARETYGKDVKIWRSGCLGKCENGIAIASYPKKELLTNVRQEDQTQLKEYIKEQVSKD